MNIVSIMTIVGVAWKTVLMKARWTTEPQLKRFQRVTVLATGVRPFWNILAKNVAAFCPCLKNLPEAEFKINGLNFWRRKLQYSLILIMLHGY